MSRGRAPGPSLRRIGRLLADRTDGGRLIRGQELFEDGMVLELVIDSDRVSADVVGSRSQPYRATIWLATNRPLPDDAWDLAFDCSCPDVGDPCKHAVAVALAYGVHLDTVHTADSADGGPRSAVPLTPPRPYAPAWPLPDQADRPAWADELPEPDAPTTIADWLGHDLPPVQAATSPRSVMDLLGDLGPCRLEPSGTDLAPAIQLLALRLAGGHEKGRADQHPA